MHIVMVLCSRKTPFSDDTNKKRRSLIVARPALPACGIAVLSKTSNIDTHADTICKTIPEKQTCRSGAAVYNIPTRHLLLPRS